MKSIHEIARLSHAKIHEAVAACHPVEIDKPIVIEADNLAMVLVGERHSKRELVNLVRWLLLGAPINQSEI